MLRYFGSKKREFLGENATSWTRRVAFVGALSVPGSRKPPCFQGNLPSENSATSKSASEGLLFVRPSLARRVSMNIRRPRTFCSELLVGHTNPKRKRGSSLR